MTRDAPHSNRKLFSQLNQEERYRVYLTIGIFAGLLLVCALLLSRRGTNDSAEYNKEIERFMSFTVSGIADREWHFKDAKHYDERRKELTNKLFERLFDRPPSLERLDDSAKIRQLSTQFVARMIGADKDVKADKNEKEEAVKGLRLEAESMLKSQFPCVKNRKGIQAWFILGILYWLIVVSFYCLGLTPSRGEPVFNVVDAGFFTTLIGFTGGLASPYSLILVPSLLLSATDLIVGLGEGKSECMATWIFSLLRVGPYVFALVMTLFWSESSRFLADKQIWTDFLGAFSFHVVIGVIIWLICCLMMYCVKAKFVMSESTP